MKTNLCGTPLLRRAAPAPSLVLSIAVMLFGAAASHAENSAKTKTAPAAQKEKASEGSHVTTKEVPAKTPAPYLAEQAIDAELGLLKRPWRINLVRLPSRLNLPAQLKAGGTPPYHQQIEKAQSAASGAGAAGGSLR